MATQVQIDAVVNAVVTAFDGDPALWLAFLERAKLETQLAEIRSEMRQAQAAHNVASGEHGATMTALALAEAEKLAEIDAL